MDLLKRCFEYILFLLTGTIIFQSILFMTNAGVSIVSLVLATILFLICCYFFKDDKKFKYNNLISILIVWIIIVVLFLYYRNFNECTYDGCYYHGNAMVNMINGWNPIIQSDINNNFKGVTVWAECYPKATWIFGANLIKLFNNISCGMIINVLVMLCVAVYGFLFTYEWKHNKILSFLVGIVLLLNPIAIEQMNTYYVDGVLGNFVIILLLLCFKIMKEYNLWDNILIVIVSIFMINIKFTGFAFAGIINFIAWVYIFFINKKSFFKYFASGLIMLFFAVVITGYSPYLVNIMKHRPLFYPILGDNPEDVITYLIPEEIANKDFFHKFTYSLTSGKGIIGNLKNYYLDQYLLFDEQIGAMGVNFFKLLLCSFLGFFVYFVSSVKNKKFDIVFWLSVLSLVITIIVNYDNMWWLRYVSHIWLFIPLGIILLFDYKYLRVISVLMFCVILLQSSIIAYNTIKTDYQKSRSIEKFYKDYNGKEVVVQITVNYIYDNDGFDAYEVARAKQYGVTIKDVKHGENVDGIKSYFMHNYYVYVLESN